MSDTRKAAESYATELSNALGDRLRSVVLHGSVARGEPVKGVSDVNLLVLLDRIDPPLLRELAPHARRWLEKQRALPLVLTWDEWAAASDAFAIETSDMLDAHEVLHGSDPLLDTTVEPRHLRIQAERELRGKLIHLRQGTLAAADRPRELGRLLLAALPSVATYLRAALRLAGEQVTGEETPAVFSRGSRLVGTDETRLLELWDLRSRQKEPEAGVEDPRVAAVHAVLEHTVEYVDTLSGGST